MKNLNRNTLKVNTYTERIIQFGEGNFLRAFANWMIHEMNKQANFDAGQEAQNGLRRQLKQRPTPLKESYRKRFENLMIGCAWP